MGKLIYDFGEGDATQSKLLGGKGANLAEMVKLGIPVPPGFTISTQACRSYLEDGKQFSDQLWDETKLHIQTLEKTTGKTFGGENPLLVSVRSGAPVSMPGMMDTVLNLGMNDNSVQGLIAKTGNSRFAWDSYRRFVQMFGGVVLGVEALSKEDHDPFEEIIYEMKEAKGVEDDTDLDTEDLIEMVARFKAACTAQTGEAFPEDPWDQLWAGVTAVFDSWMNPRAAYYRNMHGYPEEWGTAVNVQAMVYGNMGNKSIHNTMI